MALSNTDTKLLWGRAAGRCSRPDCRVDLTRSFKDQHYIVGEQAHVVGQSPAGPRAITQGGEDSYENMILLCPTCHTEIDKKPALFPIDVLQQWKKDHEEEVAGYGANKRLVSSEELTREIRMLLDVNYAFFKEYGPQSKIALANPISNAYDLWEVGRAITIVPNNTAILNLAQSNADLLTQPQRTALPAFIAHAEGFSRHVFNRLDHYPLFPVSFDKAFS
jgi:HNH endonuclease